MSDRKRLLSNMASLFTLQGANYVLPLVTLPYLVRVLGPEKFGLIAFAQAFIQYFVVATDYGFNLSATREVAVHRNNPQKLGEIISAVMAIKTLLALAGAAILGAFTLMVPTFHQQWPLYLVVYLTVAGATLFPAWLFQGLERMRDITWMNMATRLLTTAAIFIFVHNPQDYVLAAAIQSLPVLLAAVPAWWVLRKARSITWQLPQSKAMHVQIKSSWHVFLSTAAINVYTSSNTFVLGLIAGPVAVGYFSAANKVVQATVGLLSPISQTIYPHIAQIAIRSREETINFIRKSLFYMSTFGLALSAILFIWASAVIRIVLGDSFLPSVPILQWLSLFPFILALNNIYGMQTLLPLGLKKLFTKSVAISATVDIILLYPLVSSYGADGAAITMLTTEIVLFGIYTVFHYSNGIYLISFPQIKKAI